LSIHRPTGTDTAAPTRTLRVNDPVTTVVLV
jgi:hypothetical protein